jgi:hypothetical protein
MCNKAAQSVEHSSTVFDLPLKRRSIILSELKHILRKTQQFFDEQESLEQGGAVGQHQQLIQVHIPSSGPPLWLVD